MEPLLSSHTHTHEQLRFDAQGPVSSIAFVCSIMLQFHTSNATLCSVTALALVFSGVTDNQIQFKGFERFIVRRICPNAI